MASMGAAAWTIAVIPARTPSGSSGHASISRCRLASWAGFPSPLLCLLLGFAGASSEMPI